MKGFGKPAAFGSKKDRDEDLQLFREMFKRERERNNVNFLEMSEELDPSAPTSTLGNHSLYKLPSGKKESGNDFLVTGRDKNDYDWLKTPPATPLFPSLDMEANDPNLMIFHRELPIMQNLKPSRFQGKIQEPKLIKQGARSPSSRSSTSSSSRPETPSTRPTTSSGSAINLGGLMKQSASYGNKKPGPMPGTPKKSSTSSTPSTRSNTPKKSSSQPLGATSKERAVSVTRNRGSVEPKAETLIDPRRQSCSPSVIRGRRVESVEQISLKKASGNGTVIMGSRMVEKMMNARRPASVEEKDLQRKTMNLVGDRKDVGKLMSRSSLDMALKQMEISKNPSSTKNSTNGGSALSSKPSSQMTACSATKNFRDRTGSEVKPVVKKVESKIRSNNYA